MATTTNFSFSTPDDTGLVKDGALAMRTLGNNIDARFGNVATYPNQIVNVVSGISRPVAYSYSAGIGAPVWTAATTATVTITFATNRFTQAPIVTLTNNSATGSLIGTTYRALSVTNTSFQISGTAATTTTATGSVFWQAVQMTSAAASGQDFIMIFICTCHTSGCLNDGIEIEILDPSPVVVCGVCNVEITDKVEVVPEPAPAKKPSK